MQAPGMDWRIVRFVGSERANEDVNQGKRQLEAQAREPEQAPDPSDEPPPLV